MTTHTRAVGYIRVSTEHQNEGDLALKRQAEKLRQFCGVRDIQMTHIYDDTASAVDPASAARRPGLRGAARQAAREHACLMVPEPTRLFRNVEAAERWLDSTTVPVFSVKDDKILSRDALLSAIDHGQQVAESSRDGTIKALAEKKSAGVILGSKADRRAANAASKKARAQRSDGIVDQLAHVLLEDRAYRDLSHRTFADLLNRRGILTGWDLAWTAAGVKRQRKLAEARILEWQEIETCDDLVEAKSEAQPAPVSPAELEPQADAVDEEMAKLHSLPTFGVF